MKNSRVGGFWTLTAALLLIAVASTAFGQTNSTNSAPPAADDGTAGYKKMSLQELMNLDVTSVAKAPEPYGQAPAAIQVITGDDIRRSGASSIPEALRLADNLEVAQQNSHTWNISARGFNTDLANKLLVLMDGRSVYTPLYSGVFWDQQDYLLADIERIEVISGPGGTLWGANAVNGVINITSKSAKDTQGLYTEAGGGTVLEDFGAVRFGGVLGTNVFYRIYGKYFDQGDEVYANGNNAPDSWNMGQGGFRIDAENSPQNTFTLQGDFYAGDEKVPDAKLPGVSDGNSIDSGENVLGRWTHTFSADSEMSLQTYYDRTHLTKPEPAFFFEPPGTFRDDLDTFDIDFQHRFQIGDRNQIVWGLGYRLTHDRDDNIPALSFSPSDFEQNLFNIFAQDEIKIVKNLTLTLGSKLEHNDYTHFEFEPSGRLQWNATSNQMFWGAISRAVRTPSRIDVDFSESIAPGVVLLQGGSNFVSETLIAYELGYRAQITPDVSGSISTFYNNYDNVRSTSITPSGFLGELPLYFANNLEGDTYGFELNGNYQVMDGLRLHAGYNMLQENMHVKSGETDANNALNETADPQQQFSIRASLDLPKNIEFDTGLRWVDTLRYNNNGVVGTVPDYFELDSRLSWHATKNLELSIVGQNLLHDYHPEYYISGSLHEEISRSVYCKATFRW